MTPTATESSMSFVPDVVVLGSGLPAACCAYEFARRGHRVALYGESMTGPVPAVRWAAPNDLNEDLLAFSTHGLAGLHDARRTLGGQVLRATGALAVAVDSLEWAKLQLRSERFRDAGVACEIVGGGVLPAIEPMLSNSLPGGVYFPDGLSFEPMELSASLLDPVEQATFGAKFRIDHAGDGSVTFVSGDSIEAGIVVVVGRQGPGCGVLRQATGTAFEGQDKLSLPVSTGSATFGPTASGWEGVSERPVQTYQEIRRAFPTFDRDDTRPVQWCRTPDDRPVVGRSKTPGSHFVATGLEGFDLAVVMGAAMTLSALVEGRSLPLGADRLSPARLSQSHGAAG